MNSVFICDDEPFWLDTLEKYVTQYQIKSDWALQISYKATSSTELLDYIRLHNVQNGIYFLDINFKTDMNGLTLAAEIHKTDPHPRLIFVTTEEELMAETFRRKLEALDYLVKNDTHLDRDIFDCLRHLEQQYFATPQAVTSRITIKLKNTVQALPLSNIYYIETVKHSHKVTIHLSHEIITAPATLTSLLDKLDEHFIQISKGCVVNTLHIRELQKTGRKIIFENDEICTCSLRSWTQLSKKFVTIQNQT